MRGSENGAYLSVVYFTLCSSGPVSAVDAHRERMRGAERA